MKKYLLLFSFAVSISSAILAQSQNSGVGTVVPLSKFEIRGAGTTSVTSSLNVTTSDSTSVLYIRNDKRVGIRNSNPLHTLDAVGTMRLRTGSAGASNSATGGTITTSGAYTVHTFTSTATFTPASGMTVEYLVVAGGGGGGAESSGGGGAGGFLTSTVVISSAQTITVGAGGAGGASASYGQDGGSSSIGSLVTTTGGGGGAGSFQVGRTGGSGGGSSFNQTTGGAGTSGQGNAGSRGYNDGQGLTNGAGGGAGQTFSTGTRYANGGTGLQSSINGTATYYAGGGGAGRASSTGGLGGGGNGSTTNGSAGTSNTGGGGGGGGVTYTGGAGGSGIVIIRYLTSNAEVTTLMGDTMGRIAIGLTTPSAFLHLPSGLGIANYAPLKFQTGATLATPETGAVEYDGARLYYTTSTPTRIPLLGHNLGLLGGSTLIGGTASGENLTFQSTSHGTKGKILLGNSAYDEVNNRLGLGTTTPGYILTVNGQPAANGYTAFTNYSDSRLKKDVAEVEGGNLEKIMQLHPVKFKYNNKYLQFYNDTAIINRSLKGFIAQEVKEIFPEMVGTRRMDDGTEYYDLNLSNLPVYIVKAMQEQQNIITDLKTQLQNYKARLEALEQQ